MTSEQILIVEDEGLVAADIKAHLEESGWQVPAVAQSGEEALDLMENNHYDLVLMDIVLSGKKDGIETAALIRDKYQTPVIYLTAYTDNEKVTRARMTNPYGYLVKPFDERELKTTVSMSLSKSVNDRAISEGKRWVNAVLNSIEDGVITTDSYGRIRDVNSRAELITGQDREECINNLLTEVLRFSSKKTQQQFKHSIDQIIDTGVSAGYRIDGYLLSNRKKIFIRAKLSSISYTDGNTDGIVVTFHDATLKHEAEAASRAKSRFFYNVFHELKKPLKPVPGFSKKLLEDNRLSDKQFTYIRNIDDSCKNLLKKINDLIDLSQIELNDYTTNNISFDPVQLLNKANRSFGKRFSEKGIGFEIVTSERKAGKVLGDYDRLTNVLHHLLDNALKYTESGTVILSMNVISEDISNMSVRFNVDDTGPGLPDNVRNSFSEKYPETHDTNNTGHQKMGVGLTLCKKLIEYLGGRTGASKKESGGSVLWFEVNLVKTAD